MTATCSECGSALVITTAEVDTYLDLVLTIEPCQECLAQKKSEIEHLESELSESATDCLGLEKRIEELENE